MSQSSIPDGISFADLQKLAEQAPVPANDEKREFPNKMSDSEMRHLVADTVEELTDKFGTMFGYKLTAMYALSCLYNHHNEVHAKACEKDDFEAALCWARDAGWVQMMLKCLTDIHTGPDDFLAPED